MVACRPSEHNKQPYKNKHLRNNSSEIKFKLDTLLEDSCTKLTDLHTPVGKIYPETVTHNCG